MSNARNSIDTAVPKMVRAWLFGLAALLFVLVIVGGATRLTDSGLSITQWRPILGTIPPLSAQAWQEAFARYKEIPEYRLINLGMSLDEFQIIYWWEWTHRFLGRLTGLYVAGPLLVFVITGRLKRPWIYWVLGLFCLGLAQGLLGWYMVKSGLVDRVDVSPYRLAAHLGLAALIFSATLLCVSAMAPVTERRHPSGTSRSGAIAVGILFALVFLQIVTGGLVAGLDAGQGYNTWPLMEGAIVPKGLAIMTPWWHNLFENPMTVQFIHRLIAYTIALGAIWLFAHTRDRGAFWILVAVISQVILGIGVLVLRVPLVGALAHQGLAFVILGVVCVYGWHAFAILRSVADLPAKQAVI